MRIHCREITEADLDRVVNLLTKGFAARTNDFWRQALDRLGTNETIPNLPKYGYVLEVDAALVGVLLLISSVYEENGSFKKRCNMSSWYVERQYRNYAALLVSRALRHEAVTYFNITPDPPTLPILEAQGYVRYCSGRFLCAPVLSRGEWGARISVVRPGANIGCDLPTLQRMLLLKHAGYGCFSLICSFKGRDFPFVFLPLRKADVVPYVYLAYCPSVDDFRRFAGPLGRFLILKGYALVVVDSNGPIKGLIGKYFDGAPKYYRGPDQPRLGDIAFSERVIFGY